MELDYKEILINNDSELGDIQNEFSTCYPFLKIDFFVKGNGTQSRKTIVLDPRTPLQQLGNITPRKIDINRHRSVSEISNDFEEMLGVIVQVSRKSGRVWNTISVSDSWTLQSQNIAGEYISAEMALNTN